jgi:hypothetical protein
MTTPTPAPGSPQAPRSKGKGLLGFYVGLVVVALLFVGGWFTWTRLHASSKRIRENAAAQRCEGNLRTIGLAISMYTADHGVDLPPSFDELCFAYIDNVKVFSCRSKRSYYRDIAKTGKVTPVSTSYVYVSGLKRTDKPNCILASDRIGNHEESVNVVFLDAHCEKEVEVARLYELLEETAAHVKEKGRKIKLLYGSGPLP